MSRNNLKRKRGLQVYLTEGEITKIQERLVKSTYRSFSEYARVVLLGEPLIACFRNQSADDLLEEIIILISDLRVIARNFEVAGVALRQLHSCNDVSSWVLQSEINKEMMLNKIADIRQLLIQMSDKW